MRAAADGRADTPVRWDVRPLLRAGLLVLLAVIGGSGALPTIPQTAGAGFHDSPVLRAIDAGPGFMTVDTRTHHLFVASNPGVEGGLRAVPSDLLMVDTRTG